MKFGKIGAVVSSIALLFGMSACGTVAKTGPDYQALMFDDGAYSKQTFIGCLPPSDRKRTDIGGINYYYPIGERTFEFDGSDSEPIKIQTKDGQEVSVSGVITFNFTSDCALLKKFHDEKGAAKKYYFTNSGDTDESGAVKYTSEGWDSFLDKYFAIPTRSAFNTESLKYNWRELYSSSEVQRGFETAAVGALPTAINRLVGEGVVSITNVQITTPQPSDALKKTIEDVEVSKGTATAAEEKAKADLKAQEAKNKLAEAELNKDRYCVELYGADRCMYLKLAETGKVQFVPLGTKLVVTPQQ